MKRGIKETKTAYLVNLDEYTNRDRFYTGDKAGIVLRIEKKGHKDLLKPCNYPYETNLDLLLAYVEHCDELSKGVTYYRKGHYVE